MTSHSDDLAAQSGAYALNALTEEERAAFEAHLAESSETRTETTELSDTAVALGLAVDPVTPAPALKATLMAMIAQTPQLPREVSAAEATQAAAPVAATPAEAMVTSSALIYPLLSSLGLDAGAGPVLAVLAIGAGAMVVSHANDSFFWVVSQFSRIPTATAYRTITPATAIQGTAAFAAVAALSAFLV